MHESIPKKINSFVHIVYGFSSIIKFVLFCMLSLHL